MPKDVHNNYLTGYLQKPSKESRKDFSPHLIDMEQNQGNTETCPTIENK